MVRIYEDDKSGEIVVWTSCTSIEAFMLDLAPAMADLKGDKAVVMSQVLQAAFPVAFKLAGYKADEVHEERTLWAGKISPENCKVISKGGRE